MFLLVLLLTQVETFFNRSGLMAQFPHLLNTSPPLLFLLGPLLYIHTQRQLTDRISIRQHWVHFLPCLAYLSYSWFFFAQPEAFKYDVYIRTFQPAMTALGTRPAFDTDPLNIQGLVVVELISLHMTAYALYSLWLIRRSQVNGVKHWLMFINIMLSLGGITLFLAQGGIVNGHRFLDSLLPNFSADLFPTLATYALSIYVINGKINTKSGKAKYSKSALHPELQVPKAKKIHELLKTERPFLNQNFSLSMLAELSQMSPHHLSQVLNEQMQMSFFDLSNQYRIEEAKRILEALDHPPKMEALAYELGYKSKSTFYKAFKEATGNTPLQFFQKRTESGLFRPD